MSDSDYDVDEDFVGYCEPLSKQVQEEEPTVTAYDELSSSLIEEPAITPEDEMPPSFTGLGVHPVLAHHLSSRMSIQEPTKIQKLVYQAVLGKDCKDSDRDICIESETGSGKTLSFLVPIVQSLLFPKATPAAQLTREIGPLVLILSPTRELAQQIHGVTENLINIARSEYRDANGEDGEGAPHAPPRHWLVSSTLLGGDSKKSEKARVRKGINILVSTPGRFLDHLRTTSALDVSGVRWIVLDEADRLLDMGFEKDIRAIIDHVYGRRDARNPSGDKEAQPAWSLPESPVSSWPSRRQVILCSATMSKISSLAGWVLHKPIKVSASRRATTTKAFGAGSEATSGPANLKHEYMVTPTKLKALGLLAFLKQLTHSSAESSSRKTIVFFATRASVDFYHAWFSHFFEKADKEQRRKLGLHKLHGSMDPQQRKTSLAAFDGKAKKGGAAADAGTTAHVLLTTDVAARGLDLAQVDTIIQYDAPTDVDEYVHRAGRTARAGQNGRALLFLLPHEADFATKILVSQVSHGAGLKPMELSEIIRKVIKCKPELWEKEAHRQWQMRMEDWVARDKDAKNLAQEGYLSFVRGYATYPSSLKHLFHVRNLHLGHVAKTFGLKEAPKAIAGANTAGKDAAAKKKAADNKKRQLETDPEKKFARGAENQLQSSLMSEFNIGSTMLAISSKKRKKD